MRPMSLNLSRSINGYHSDCVIWPWGGLTVNGAEMGLDCALLTSAEMRYKISTARCRYFVALRD
jgi:hypothetical protein